MLRIGFRERSAMTYLASTTGKWSEVVLPEIKMGGTQVHIDRLSKGTLKLDCFNLNTPEEETR